eukprot:CAMPEP_0206004946 /NCGR_PEP_ID=MMETSP1464-20131121/4284_1 /ASSEMBLY_ACC=CAM_ASM_001124 /TAXON_ID=119497 /ORGANISM="Exanthemachrysis gayraliae, Strain RCC1523" /LENGTH=86 /DNA_ID=CAMNT_0053378365 /DNA_START=28 /DNA_END=288 /DNA_ORIENTATION=-
MEFINFDQDISLDPLDFFSIEKGSEGSDCRDNGGKWVHHACQMADDLKEDADDAKKKASDAIEDGKKKANDRAKKAKDAMNDAFGS